MESHHRHDVDGFIAALMRCTGLQTYFDPLSSIGGYNYNHLPSLEMSFIYFPSSQFGYFLCWIVPPNVTISKGLDMI
jgi:hypothetical protein